MIRTTFLAAALVGLFSTPTLAAITYVDAVFSGSGANTTLADGTAMNEVADQASLTNPEDYWNKGDSLDPVGQIPHWLERPRAAANGGSVFVGSPDFGGTNVDVPTLKTTISGLTPGASYNVYGYYWGRGSAVWDIEFGLSEAGLAAFPDPGVSAADSTFTNPVSLNDSGVIPLTQANLGETVASAAGTIDVFVNDGPSPDRTWYDGVGFEPIPEPSTIAIGLIAGIGLLVGKRSHLRLK